MPGYFVHFCFGFSRLSPAEQVIPAAMAPAGGADVGTILLMSKRGEQWRDYSVFRSEHCHTMGFNYATWAPQGMLCDLITPANPVSDMSKFFGNHFTEGWIFANYIHHLDVYLRHRLTDPSTRYFLLQIPDVRDPIKFYTSSSYDF